LILLIVYLPSVNGWTSSLRHSYFDHCSSNLIGKIQYLLSLRTISSRSACVNNTSDAANPITSRCAWRPTVVPDGAGDQRHPSSIKEGPLIKNGPINFVHNFFPNSPWFKDMKSTGMVTTFRLRRQWLQRWHRKAWRGIFSGLWPCGKKCQRG